MHEIQCPNARSIVRYILSSLSCAICVSLVGCESDAPAPAFTCDTFGYLELSPDEVATHLEPRGYDPWVLWESGTHLRGANIFQRRTYPDWDDGWNGDGDLGPPYVQGDFDQLRAAGANVVNVSHPGLIDENAPYNRCDPIQDHLDRLLEMLEEADLFAVISFRTGPGRNEFSLIGPDEWADNSVWQSDADQDAWVDMWRYTARRYRNHPVVVGYDLMVEPNANEVLGEIWEPEEFYSQYRDTLADWNPLADRIVRAIREEDAETPVIVGGMSYSAVPWLSYIDVGAHDRLVLAAHQYAPVDYTHNEGRNASCTRDRYEGEPCTLEELRSFLSPLSDVVASGTPVTVNEYGGIRWVDGIADFIDAEVTVFEEIGLNHMMWQWDSEFELALENDTFNIKHGTDEDNHAVVPGNPLLEMFERIWSLNTEYLSTML